MTMQRTMVFDEVWDERERQDAKWGEQNHPDHGGRSAGASDYADYARKACNGAAELGWLSWTEILEEEFAEALAEAESGDVGKLREELVQVAAVAVAWAEAIDRRG